MSGVQMTTRSTRGSAAAAAAAAASASSASNSTIGQTATPSAGERFFEQRELREQVGLDASAGLVAGPELVAKRLDDVIGRDADVRRAAVIIPSTDVSTPRTAPTSRPSAIARGRKGVVVAEQLVRAVDEMNVQ